jgi:hypothetical protein
MTGTHGEMNTVDVPMLVIHVVFRPHGLGNLMPETVSEPYASCTCCFSSSRPRQLHS